jgi:hypothetical protein
MYSAWVEIRLKSVPSIVCDCISKVDVTLRAELDLRGPDALTKSGFSEKFVRLGYNHQAQCILQAIERAKTSLQNSLRDQDG